MSEMEKTKEEPEEPKEDVIEDTISEDLERISKVVEEELVIPEDEIEDELDLLPAIEEAEEIPLIELANSINSIRSEITKLYEKVDNLEQTMSYLIDSINEIKSIILMLSHGKTEKMQTSRTISTVKIVEKILEKAEEIQFSIHGNEILRAIKIESLLFDIEDLLEKASTNKIKVPKEQLDQLKKVYKTLNKESELLQKKILATAR